MLEIKETYINATRENLIGDSGWYEPYQETRGQLFRSLQKEYGRCESKMYRDRGKEVDEVGWVFAKKMRYEDARQPYTARDYYTREVWVEVRES